jgi:benzoyl-CoA reductase/2-hydroxyglutaryl-CoA dehydratase subunit BcrC/BadD/HgdB
MEQRGVGKALREAAVPVLFMETDYSPEDRGQVSTRIEAFVESIQSRKER